jgi:uncharacterized membrane protein
MPIKHRLGLLTAATLIIALLMMILAAAGIVMQNVVYPTEDLRQSFAANDWVNLLLGLPILLISLRLAWRGKLLGLLFWPGALFFVVYNAIAYVFALPPILEARRANALLESGQATGNIVLLAPELLARKEVPNVA